MEPSTEPRVPESRLTATLAGDGQPGPIEERIGRRLVRILDPESDEGRELLEQGSIEWIGPDGEPLGALPAVDAFDLLISRLQRRLESIDAEETVAVRQRLEQAIDDIRARGDALRR